MDQNKRWIKRISAVLLIVLGLMIGGTWRKAGICFGDELFSMIGLPAWSEGTKGFHYPAMAGVIFILIGIGILNTALSKKQRIWVWSTVLLLLVLINFLSGFMGTEHETARSEAPESWPVVMAQGANEECDFAAGCCSQR